MQAKQKYALKDSWDDKLFSIVTGFFILLLTAVCLIPFLYLLAESLSGAGPVMRGEVFLIPKEFTLETYRSIFQNGTLVSSLFRTVFLTIASVLVSMTVTVMCAYPLSIPGLKGKKGITFFIMVTMYFSGGMIPSYLLVHKLGLIDSYWSLILPCALSTYNMLVMRSFFVSIPSSLREAALIDGAGDFAILTKVVLPLSKPALATISLFYAVSRWNGLQDALLYINDPSKAVLQIRLKQLIQSTEAMKELMQEGAMAAETMPTQAVRAGTLIFSMIPILIIYPFLQKYFVKGTMIGSVKG